MIYKSAGVRNVLSMSKARRSQYSAVATFSVVSSKSSLPNMLVATILHCYNLIFTFYPR